MFGHSHTTVQCIVLVIITIINIIIIFIGSAVATKSVLSSDCIVTCRPSMANWRLQWAFLLWISSEIFACAYDEIPAPSRLRVMLFILLLILSTWSFLTELRGVKEKIIGGHIPHVGRMTFKSHTFEMIRSPEEEMSIFWVVNILAFVKRDHTREQWCFVMLQNWVFYENLYARLDVNGETVLEV